MVSSLEASRERCSQLEQLLEQRTAELAETRKELDSFSYSVSHDLRAPLRHLEGYLDILEEDHDAEFGPEVRQRLQTIRVSAGRLKEMLEELLRLARLGRRELRLQQVVLAELVREAIAELCGDAPSRQVDWQTGELPAFTCDPQLVRELYIHLLSNALKFTRTRIDATVSVGSTAKNDETIFYVRDNGVGFDMKYADRLFTIFQRLHARDEFEGRGAGLASAYRIVRMHGGRIWAEAQRGQGATFYFTLQSSPLVSRPEHE